MKAEPEFDLIRFLKEIHQRRIRCLLIGRWAVAQHGAPVVTADYDFWVDRSHRDRLFRLLVDNFEAELPPDDRLGRPMVSVYVGPDKIDCFSARKIINAEGEELEFAAVYTRSEVKRSPEEALEFRIPCIDDMIAMKKFSQQDPVKHTRNLEDIRFLLTLKRESGQN